MANGKQNWFDKMLKALELSGDIIKASVSTTGLELELESTDGTRFRVKLGGNDSFFRLDNENKTLVCQLNGAVEIAGPPEKEEEKEQKEVDV